MIVYIIFFEFISKLVCAFETVFYQVFPETVYYQVFPEKILRDLLGS